MQKGDIILVELTGRNSESRKVFETTSREIAEKEGILSENAIYKPIAIVVGKQVLVKGLEKAIEEMKEGEERKLSLMPEEAFGERKQELVGIVPLKEFQNRKINPFPGLIVDLNGNAGRVQSISGGRVRVDFNNDLAGKQVEFEVKVLKKLETTEEKAKALVEKILGRLEAKIKVQGEEAEIELPEEVQKSEHLKVLEKIIEKEILENVKELKKVKFKEEAEKIEEKPKV
jgi:FKBP-type peptidyl-prolyl cis-trans isomerase 2